MSENPIIVGIADMKAAFSPSSIITTGLGSCVGVCIWDSHAKIGGMVHVMLPESGSSNGMMNKAKYADTGVALLVQEIFKLGAAKNHLSAKIAGGAQMFSFPGSISVMRIGERNIEAVKQALELQKIKIVAEDTGGNFGRTIQFFTESGLLHIKTINRGEKLL
jgi:chemotaxis protein CheD